MQDLIQQERFELEVLDKLNGKRLLSRLIFCGGTMLRLCFGLDRFSVDLDFWLAGQIDSKELFKKLRDCLNSFYKLTDSADKFNTLLFELRSPDYPRSLKLEIRKQPKEVPIEQAIAYSKYSNTQVILKAASLKYMVAAKIEAFLERGEIRDVFDLEFLLKKGIPLSASSETSALLLKKMDALNKNDYKVKLGSLLETAERKYYITENFKLLRLALQQK